MPKEFIEPKHADALTNPGWSPARVRPRVMVIGLCVLVATFISLIKGYQWFGEWRAERIVRTAQLFIDQQDYRSAHMLLEKFVKDHPGHRLATRLYAKTIEASDAQAAADLWTKLIGEPGAGSEDYVGAATVALRLARWDDMQSSLARLKALQPASTEYHRLSAARALAQRDTPALRQNLEALVRLEPHNEVMRYSLATVMLDSVMAADREQAREILEGYARGNRLRIRAVLALIEDAPRRWPDEKNPSQLLGRLARQLGPPDVRTAGTYAPNLLGVRQSVEDLVGHMKSQPTPDASDAVALAHWLMRQGRAREAMLWLDTLDADPRRAPEVLTAMSACAVKLGSWRKLEQLLRENAWGPVPAQAITLAFQAREERLGGGESRVRSLWSQALAACDQSLPGLHMLQRLAQVWMWPDLRSQVLWVVVRKNPREVWAWPVLAELAMQARDTAEVWRVYGAWEQAVPDNLQARIERVLLGLLVRPATPGLAEQAEALYQQHPDRQVCRVVKALALWRAGRSREGLAFFETQTPAHSHEPRFALAHALLLAQEGRLGESRQILAGLPVDKLLPEEVALMSALAASPPVQSR
jgi:hypothetical protein